MRTAILTRHSASDYPGGVEVFNSHISRVLGDVTIYTPTFGGAKERFPYSRLGLEQPMYARSAARAFLEHQREDPFDLVIANGVYGWPLSFARVETPVIQVYHFTMAGLARNSLQLRGDRLTTGVVTAFFDRLAGFGKNVVTVSKSVRAEVERYYGLRSVVIPNCVDSGQFAKIQKEKARSLLGLPDDKVIGLFVGRTEYTKGLDVLVALVRIMREVQFVAVGGRVAGEPNLTFRAHVPHKEMPLYYSAADFFVLPSRYEGFNLSILEALSCGVPIVVSAAAYPFDENPDELGYVARSLDPSEFAHGVRSVLNPNRPFRTREFVLQEYSSEHFERRWRTFLESISDDPSRQ